MLHILTLHWNKEKDIDNLYKSLKNITIPYKWHIRDHASKDNSVSLIKSWNDNNINLIEYKTNEESFSKGMNFLFDQANSNDDDYILLLNNDIIFKDINSINKMINLFSNDVGIVGAKLNYMSNNTIQHAGIIFSQNFLLPYHYRDKYAEEDRDRYNRYFDAVTGAVLLTKSSIYKEIRFDQNYYYCYEDIDFCLRVKYNLNKKIIYCGETNILHECSGTLKKNPVNKLYFKENCEYFKSQWSSKLKETNWNQETINYIVNEKYKVI